MNIPFANTLRLYAGTCLLLAFFSAMVAAQEPGLAEVTRMLKGPERIDITKGVEAARRELTLRPKQALKPLRDQWLPSLMAAGAVREADTLALEAVVQAVLLGESPALQESLLEFRVRALLAQKAFPAALGAARSLYNCASLDRTARAIETVSTCLAAANNGDDKTAARFRLEQLLGAATRPTTSTRPQAVLAGLVVDAKPYEAALASVQGDDFAALTRRGNLLLLANRTGEARRVFEDAYRVSPARDLASATENIARAMRADDGNVARANEWVISARPR